MVTFNKENIITDIKQLEEDIKITFFLMEFKNKPSSDLLQKLCIEIARHTPDAISGNNEDTKNEKRLNPFVGAILVKKEKDKYLIYGASRSALHNGEHGECGLLLHILGDYIVDNCEIYVSLEPCTQESRHEWTEPCCEIIKNRRIKKVSIGMLDPNPDVAGHGISYLIKNNIEVCLFDPKYQKIVLDDNKFFAEQFKDGSDPRLNRKIARILDAYVSDTAIDYFLKTAKDELEFPYYEDRFADNKKNFYRTMIENRSIVDGGSVLLPYDVIDDFALFFFKKPYHKVDGATIRFIFDWGTDSKESDYPECIFNKPYAFAFETFDKDENFGAEDMGFVECIGKRYYGSTAKSLQGLHTDGIQFLKDKLGYSHGVEIAREAFINAIIHRDYKDNHSFIRVMLKDDRIEIYNPIEKDIDHLDKLKNDFKNFDVPSHPVNPKLMRYFQLMSMCERNGNGLQSLKNSGKVSIELQDDFVLKTTILFEPKK